MPFMLHGVDASLMVEQSFPLSGVRGHRQRAAEADARRLRAESERVSQDVQLDAARAFLILRERRAMRRVLDERVALARQFVAAASARDSSGTGNQPEVLGAEIEVARFEGAIRTTAAEVLAAEAMLNASLGRPADAPMPPLEATPLTNEPRPWAEVRSATLRRRPELEVGRAEISRSQAEIAEMQSMYWPMGMIRTGPAYTMADGWGWMLTVGVSVPLQRGRLKAGVREAEAMAEMARADFAAMSRMAEGEAATARGQVLAARERLLALRDDILPRARQAIDPSVSACAAGTAPLVSVIDTAQALCSIEAELVSADFELGLARVRFQRAPDDVLARNEVADFVLDLSRSKAPSRSPRTGVVRAQPLDTLEGWSWKRRSKAMTDDDTKLLVGVLRRRCCSGQAIVREFALGGYGITMSGRKRSVLDQLAREVGQRAHVVEGVRRADDRSSPTSSRVAS